MTDAPASNRAVDVRHLTRRFGSVSAVNDLTLAVRSGEIYAPADVFRGDVNITKIRSNGVYWADGGIVSTADEMIVFLRALREGRIVRKDTLELMHDWHRMRFPLQYGYGMMYFALPRPVSTLAGLPPLWGHSGSTGSFLYYCEDLDLYMAGTLDQTEKQTKPFVLMSKVIRGVKEWEGARRPDVSGRGH